MMKWMVYCIWCFSLLIVPFIQADAAESYPRYLSLAAIFQDEADYLKEWIEFYQMQGVEHFYLYNNLSHDHFQEVLDPYIEQGTVELIDWSYDHTSSGKWDSIQLRSIQDAIRRSTNETKWLAIVDTDEFIVPAHQRNLARLLKTLERKSGNKDVAQYRLFWVVFGTSGVAKIPDGQLMVEALTLNGGATHCYKSIVRPQFVALNKKMNAHSSTLKGHKKTKKVSTSVATVNHYMFRDQDYMYNVKIPRRLKIGSSKNRVLSQEAVHNNETEFSTRMERFIPELRDRMGL